MTAVRTTLGFSFTCELGIDQMRVRLGRAFTLGGSDRHGDYLGGRLTS